MLEVNGREYILNLTIDNDSKAIHDRGVVTYKTRQQTWPEFRVKLQDALRGCPFLRGP